MSRRIGALALGFTAMTAVSLTTVLPAHAESSDCGSGYVCMWEDPGYDGSLYVRRFGEAGNHDIDGLDGDNEISAVYNATNFCVRLYDNDDWTGTSYLINPHTMLPDLKQNGYDNEAESFKIFAC